MPNEVFEELPLAVQKLMLIGKSADNCQKLFDRKAFEAGVELFGFLREQIAGAEQEVRDEYRSKEGV